MGRYQRFEKEEEEEESSWLRRLRETKNNEFRCGVIHLKNGRFREKEENKNEHVARYMSSSSLTNATIMSNGWRLIAAALPVERRTPQKSSFFIKKHHLEQPVVSNAINGKATIPVVEVRCIHVALVLRIDVESRALAGAFACFLPPKPCGEGLWPPVLGVS